MHAYGNCDFFAASFRWLSLDCKKTTSRIRTEGILLTLLRSPLPIRVLVSRDCF